jgi:hypothetical protein
MKDKFFFHDIQLFKLIKKLFSSMYACTIAGLGTETLYGKQDT